MSRSNFDNMTSILYKLLEDKKKETFDFKITVKREKDQQDSYELKVYTDNFNWELVRIMREIRRTYEFMSDDWEYSEGGFIIPIGR